MWRLSTAVSLISWLQGAVGQGSPPIIELQLGVIHSWNVDLRVMNAIIVADMDYRKNFEPELVRRFGPPILQIPSSAFNASLRVRPILVEDGDQESVAVASTNNFVFGLNGYQRANAIIGPGLTNVAVAAAPSGSAYQMNMISPAATSEALSDKTKYPYFFRMVVPGSVQGRAMWEYVTFFAFRSFTIICVQHDGPAALKEGVMAAAAAARRSESIALATVLNTVTNTSTDLADWGNAITFATAARNRLVIVLAPQPMIAIFTRWLPDNGLCAPKFQLLYSNAAFAWNEWPLSMEGAHGVNMKVTVDRKYASLVSMALALNASDILNQTQRYGFDRWRTDIPILRFYPQKIPQALIRAPPDPQQGAGIAAFFNAFYTYVRAFGELLNEGVSPQDIRGDRLRAKLLQTDYEDVLYRSIFDANQNVISDFAIYSINVTSPTGKNNARFVPLSVCVIAKGVNGTQNFTMVSAGAAKWATGAVSATAPLELTACPAGQQFVTKDTGGVRGSGVCKDCADGFYTDSMDQTECQRCPAGTYGNQARTECIACAAGKYNPDKASKTCIACMPGSVAEATGSEACYVCPLGKYAATPTAGATACVDCGDGLTTAQVASLSNSTCVCAEGTYMPIDGDNCLACGTGLSCPVGSSQANIPAVLHRRLAADAQAPYPEVLPGYYTEADDPFSVYQCSSTEVCPGGPPESCVPNHKGLVCGECDAGFWRTPTGGCKECAKEDSAPIALIFAAAAVVAVGLAIFSLQEEGGQRPTLITAILAAGQLVASLQALSVIQQVKVSWLQPVLRVWQATGAVSYDLDVLKMPCGLHEDDPVVSFVVQLVSLPCVAILLCVIMLLLSRCRGLCGGRCIGKTARFSCDRYLNLLGLLVVMIYISITVAMLRPFNCKQHPNGLHSMASRLDVVCWRTEKHHTLIGLSVIGVVCYPVALLVTVGWATFQYPAKVAAAGSLAHTRRYRFVFARFTPECYYWGYCYLFRNLTFSLVPIICPDSNIGQLMLLCVILLPFLTMETALMPWRTRLANASEIFSLIGLLFFLQAAAFLVANDDAAQLVTYLLLAIVLGMFFTIALVALYALVRTFAPGVRYQVFLCHHKDGAGSLARWFKIQAATVSKVCVFLDSDQIEAFDMVVDIIHYRTSNVVTLLTRLTLSRIWCAAELATAVSYKVPIVAVACCDYEHCDQDFVDQLGDLWSDSQKHAVAQTGITIQRIQQAYQHLLGLELLQYARFAPLEEQLAATFQALNRCNIAGNPPPRPSANVPAQVVIIGASSDAEARASCEVLRILLEGRMEAVVATAHTRKEAQVHSTSAMYLIVLLTRGLLQDDAFIEVGLAFEDEPSRTAPVEVVTALADPNFTFVGMQSIDLIERQGGERGRAANFVRKVFNIVALPLTPHGSRTLLDKQVADLSRVLRESHRSSGGSLIRLISKSSMSLKGRTSEAVNAAGKDSNTRLADRIFVAKDHNTDPARQSGNTVEQAIIACPVVKTTV